MARRDIRLFAFPYQLGWGIAGHCSTAFAAAEDLVEESVLHETYADFP